MTTLLELGDLRVLHNAARFWVVKLDAKMPPTFEWCATHYPSFKTIDETIDEIIRVESLGGSPPWPEWLRAGRRTQVSEALQKEAARAQAAATGP